MTEGFKNVKIDCFAFWHDNGRQPACRVLRDLYCRKEECKFYKSVKQHMDEVKKYG